MSSLIDDLYNIHKGDTCIIVGNGPSLNAIPNDLLNKYTSFGCNKIWERAHFTPDYYVAVDSWVPEENKFNFYNLESAVILPDSMMEWKADYYFHKRDGPIWIMDLAPDYMRKTGIKWIGVTHAMLQLAFFMGFSRFLCVGLDNTNTGRHFYTTETERREVDPELWDYGFAVLRDCFIPRLILNISEETAVEALPRADWRNFV